ncbi:hypothetical protein LSH36_323g01022 [Paralvinella palmiformis]|uniref:Uncharacterized protein n=1 Tax=Paralvinella palmiformis TaxID=53620 RepID=A0AAD9JI48_9ANNE|nr:hypothetical protein LSH36_323g01022 [Paralvinella palmiformis]
MDNSATRITSSAVRMDPDRIRKAKDIRSRTLMLKLDPAGKPYSRLDVVLALANTAVFKDNFENLECLGTLSRNAEWYVTLKDDESKLKLINEVIKGRDTCEQNAVRRIVQLAANMVTENQNVKRGTYVSAAGSVAPATAETADMDEEVISTIDKDPHKEEPMELGQKNNPSESPDIREHSVEIPTEQTEITAEETVKTVSSSDDNSGEDLPIAKPAENVHTDNTTTKTWADETTDQEILKWILPSDPRRRRQEKRPRERASSLSLNRKMLFTIDKVMHLTFMN